MRRAVPLFVVLAACLLVALPLSAGEKGKGKKKGAGGQLAQLLERVRTLDLSGDQSAKVKEVETKFAEKIAKLNKVLADVEKPLNEARKKASDEGKKGRDLQKAIEDAVPLTAEQKEARTEREKLMGQVREELAQILTPEQREKIKLEVGRGGKKREK
jgi:Spy/CpxP family protein refolding chaperone